MPLVLAYFHNFMHTLQTRAEQIVDSNRKPNTRKARKKGEIISVRTVCDVMKKSIGYFPHISCVLYFNKKKVIELRF